MQFPAITDVLAVHALLVSETGGQPGLRDKGLLNSAMKAAENRYYYEQADVPVCAATYAYHWCMAHAFLDGNKRIAAAVSETFLLSNGWQLSLSNKELVDVFSGIADGRLNRDAVEAIFRQYAISSGGQ